jgi:hypothetical protein
VVELTEEEYLAHYGTPRHSGRYPWGTSGWGAGELEGSQRNMSFVDFVEDMKKKGLSEKEIIDGLGLTSTEFRIKRSISRAERQQARILQAQRLADRGLSNGAIAERMGLAGESSVRALLAPGAKEKADSIFGTSNMLKKHVDEKGFIDIGAGVENYLDISKEKLANAVGILREQGYKVHRLNILQQGTGLETKAKVLGPPDSTQRDAFMNRDNIQQIVDFTEDGGKSWKPIPPPISIDPSRIAVNYSKLNDKGEEVGGGLADGVMYVRPGVEDVSLGKSNYAQVRILVGEDRYLKGMAMYKDDLPSGVDILFNTSKSDTGNKLDALKKVEPDPNMPFGSVVRPNSNPKSALNIVHEEGDWTTWSQSLASQVLSKQPPRVAKEQLDKKYRQLELEYKDIMELTNPTVRKKLLETFSNTADAHAVHLKAAHLPRQGWYAILPVQSMKDSEVYAPNYKNGERVALIRYPHGGTFEIPELTVNNKHPESRRLLGNAPDAIGINAKVAERLSGADFDGDTVLVIPNDNKKIRHTPALKALEGFNAKTAFPGYKDMPKISPDTKQTEMGKISNLITDMTIKGAAPDEIARAVKHSMVVIDAEKHNLNYKESARVNGIAALKSKYQGGPTSGASTLISLAGSKEYIPKRKPRPESEGGPIDRVTGEKMYVPTGQTRTTKSGAVEPKRERVKKLALTNDAYTLVVPSPGTPIERIYADHSNRMKALANQARLSYLKTPPIKWEPSARTAYAKEVTSLDSKLALAKMNKPRERQAQIIANGAIKAHKQANPNLDGDSLKKLRFRELEKARIRTNAEKQQVEFTDREWQAVQAGAISNSKLNQLLDNANLEQVRALATPRPKLVMSSARRQRALSMLGSGNYTRAEVAAQLGVSVSTLDAALKSEGAYT